MTAGIGLASARPAIISMKMFDSFIVTTSKLLELVL